MLAESDHYRVEFRACKDDAWYTARVSLEGETLTVKYLNLPDEYDNAFRASEFGERFRPLSKQVYTWGAIVLDSEKEFQELCDFLNNPNCIVTSSTGRPWVILEKPVGLKNIKASIGRLVHVTKGHLVHQRDCEHNENTCHAIIDSENLILIF
ncbi:hypothetical protein JHK85_043965 [Glycine max]|nr:hypothetical protein JHK85_043965 [Glycine max]